MRMPRVPPVSIEPLLHSMEQLFGPGAQGGATASDLGDEHAPLTRPATWRSRAADEHLERQHALGRRSTSFVTTDHAIAEQLSATAQVVRDGKNRMGRVTESYRTDQARLASAPATPELAAMSAQLDRRSLAEASNSVRTTQGRLPALTSHYAAPVEPASAFTAPTGHWGVTTWCTPLPAGGFRCTSLFPDLSIDIYISNSDRSGGW